MGSGGGGMLLFSLSSLESVCLFERFKSWHSRVLNNRIISPPPALFFPTHPRFLHFLLHLSEMDGFPFESLSGDCLKPASSSQKRRMQSFFATKKTLSGTVCQRQTTDDGVNWWILLLSVAVDGGMLKFTHSLSWLFCGCDDNGAALWGSLLLIWGQAVSLNNCLLLWVSVHALFNHIGLIYNDFEFEEGPSASCVFSVR